MRFLYFLAFLGFTSVMYSQDFNYAITDIPEELTNNANSVVRLDQYFIDIPDIARIATTHKRIVTVLNKLGNNDVGSSIYYDNSSRVKSIKATVYDAHGNEVKKYKQRDFNDASATDGFSLHSDTRVLYLNYTPSSYPYTIVVESEKISKTTAFIPPVYSNTNYYSSTQKIEYDISYNPSLGLRYIHEGDRKDFFIREESGALHIEARNIMAVSPEAFAPSFNTIVEHIIFGLDRFNLEGVNGKADDWLVFGKWMDDNLLNGTQDLPEDTIKTIKELVVGIDDPVIRARKVYNFVQNKVRYVSIQIGIGGWKPMLSSKVDEVGYGDCKALSMYTKALLEVANVPSYYTVVYGDSDKRDIRPDFASVQGNHVILTLPQEDNSYVWLECTDQQVPFGFIAGFTDDRDVLIVTPEGGEIIHTKKYTAQDNFQYLKGTYTLNNSGDIMAEVRMSSGGIQYKVRSKLDKDNDDERKKYYYDFWNYINNLQLGDFTFKNNKIDAIFVEKISFTARNYATLAGQEMIVPINAFNRFSAFPAGAIERTQDVSVARGFSDTDSTEIVIPSNYIVQYIPENVTLDTEFGRYAIAFEKISENTLSYKRSLILNEGAYDKSNYKEFRSFLRKVAINDKQKMILVSK
ncbi:uncharacterized protein DUF3857 [Dokdonia sp. Hel_I_63]|uniref:DUF3857 domain-containing protein n=1 Tax=Dokdonia sp. Hel_I_63 TaxID=1249996 RepID=UPI001199E13E|nr:DUF3857 domain-containing protein [Dokdonia sp. Hel_I_63]TVZ22285.1 uncharacterized protein DUF3857 [Dokdonia sp. Hel_I_63]